MAESENSVSLSGVQRAEGDGMDRNALKNWAPPAVSFPFVLTPVQPVKGQQRKERLCFSHKGIRRISWFLAWATNVQA